MTEKTSENNELPPLLEQIGNLTGTSRDVLLGFLKTGKVLASSDMEKRRAEICLKCDKLTEDWRCSDCGCFLKVKLRTLYADCSLRKWPHE